MNSLANLRFEQFAGVVETARDAVFLLGRCQTVSQHETDIHLVTANKKTPLVERTGGNMVRTSSTKQTALFQTIKKPSCINN